MNWSDFSSQLKNSATLVGPLHSESLTVTEPTVFVDGGARFRKGSENFPCISVGDGDSGETKLDVRLPASKDFSDLAFVLRELPTSVVQLNLYGFVGGRLDHELANLGELHRFLKSRPNSTARMFKGGDLVLAGFNGNLAIHIEGIFSVMVLETAHISIEGACQYPYSGNLEPASSHGLSNVGSGNVTLVSRQPAFLLK